MIVSELEDGSWGYEHLRAAVVAYAKRFTTAASAEDVAQEVFLRLLRYKGCIAGVPRAFIFAMARNAAISLRAHERRLAAPAGSASVAATGPRSAKVEDDLDALLRALHSLPDGHREVVDLTVIQGLSEQEAARVLKISRSAVGARRRDALARLRQAAGAAQEPPRPALRLRRPARPAPGYARVA